MDRSRCQRGGCHSDSCVPQEPPMPPLEEECKCGDIGNRCDQRQQHQRLRVSHAYQGWNATSYKSGGNRHGIHTFVGSVPAMQATLPQAGYEGRTDL